MGGVIAALLLLDEVERQDGYNDGYDEDAEYSPPALGIFGGYSRGYDEGEADREADDAEGW
jgi:hypothetical protein